MKMEEKSEAKEVDEMVEEEEVVSEPGERRGKEEEGKKMVEELRALIEKFRRGVGRRTVQELQARFSEWTDKWKVDKCGPLNEKTKKRVPIVVVSLILELVFTGLLLQQRRRAERQRDSDHRVFLEYRGFRNLHALYESLPMRAKLGNMSIGEIHAVLPSTRSLTIEDISFVTRTAGGHKF